MTSDTLIGYIYLHFSDSNAKYITDILLNNMMSCPLLIDINSIYVALRRHVDNVSFIVTAPLFNTDVVMYE